MYGRRVFPEFVRFLGSDNFTINNNVKIDFCFKEIFTEQWLECDLNSIFPGFYQHLILDIIRNTAHAQQSKTKGRERQVCMEQRSCPGQTDLQREENRHSMPHCTLT